MQSAASMDPFRRRARLLACLLAAACLLLARPPAHMAEARRITGGVHAQDVPGTVWYVGQVTETDSARNAVNAIIFSLEGPGQLWVTLPDGYRASDFVNAGLRFRTAWFDPLLGAEEMRTVEVVAQEVELLSVAPKLSVVEAGDGYLVVRWGGADERFAVPADAVIPYAYAAGDEVTIAYRELPYDPAAWQQDLFVAAGILTANRMSVTIVEW